MKITTTQLTIHPQGVNPIYGDMATQVSLDDEAGGYFVRITQNGEHNNGIRLDFVEVKYLVKAIEMLKEGVEDIL